MERAYRIIKSGVVVLATEGRVNNRDVIHPKGWGDFYLLRCDVVLTDQQPDITLLFTGYPVSNSLLKAVAYYRRKYPNSVTLTRRGLHVSGRPKDIAKLMKRITSSKATFSNLYINGE